MNKNIGIDVGGTNLRLGVFNGLTLIEETRHQVDFSQLCKSNAPNEAWQKILHITTEAINTVLSKHADIQTIGIGFPGFIDPQTRTIAQSPNLPGLKNVNLEADLTRMLSKTDIKKIIVENDANAAAYGEYCLLNKPETGLIYVGLGTGVGGGLVHAGKPFAGFHGCAMEVGHIIVEPNGRLCGCGNHGCMERYASASGVALSYTAQNSTGQKLEAQQIAALARAGDIEAQASYNNAGEALAMALAHVLKVVDVPNVVIGGGMSGAWDLMQSAFDARLDADLIPVLRGKIKVTISSSGDQAGMLGTALLAADTI
ncbi:MAG: ROK family protein [Methylophilaceae bacterium]